MKRGVFRKLAILIVCVWLCVCLVSFFGCKCKPASPSKLPDLVRSTRLSKYRIVGTLVEKEEEKNMTQFPTHQQVVKFVHRTAKGVLLKERKVGLPRPGVWCLLSFAGQGAADGIVFAY